MHSASLAGRTAIVTGAASGIGAAAARQLARRGADVCCADLDAAGATAVAAAIVREGGLASAHALDVRDEAQWDALAAHVAAEHGVARVLVHAAGVSAAAALADVSLADWRAVMAVNLDGAFLATRFAMRAMPEGVVVHVGSASGIRPPAGAVAYAVSKGALGVLVRAAAKECREARRPLRVVAVSPGGVRTPLWRSMAFFQELVAATGSEDAAFAEMEREGGRFASADEVAAVIAFLASDEARHLNGVEVPVDGGYVL